jgi:hypothetical protein
MTRNIIPKPLQSVQFLIMGIKCDHCDWKDMSVQIEDYKDWLNHLCPHCGHNLLTQHDYDYTRVFRVITGVINAVGIPFMAVHMARKLVQGKNFNPKFREYNIEMNGRSDPKVVERR